MTPADAAARADRDAAATLARTQGRTEVRHDRDCYVVTFSDGRKSRWFDDIDEGTLRRFVKDGQACAAILAYRKANASERSQAAEKDKR